MALLKMCPHQSHLTTNPFNRRQPVGGAGVSSPSLLWISPRSSEHILALLWHNAGDSAGPAPSKAGLLINYFQVSLRTTFSEHSNCPWQHQAGAPPRNLTGEDWPVYYPGENSLNEMFGSVKGGRRESIDTIPAPLPPGVGGWNCVV